MNFFNSVFSDDAPQSSDSPASPDSQPQSLATVSSSSSAPSPWSFGDLIKTLAAKSESVIESYRRDFEEFGSELKKETAIIGEVASRAVKDLPDSLEVGATVAQESLESVGQVIDDIGASVWKSTARIISNGRDTLLSSSSDNYDSDSNSSSRRFGYGINNSVNHGLDGKPYNRFQMQIRAYQCDISTYCSEPEDLEDYAKWRLGFVVEEKSGEIEEVIKENLVVKEIYNHVVPSQVDNETFWSRYFYKMHKLKQAEDARAKLVNRVISGEDEEDLSWDFEDDCEEDDGSFSKPNSSRNANENLKDAMNASNENLEERESEKVGLVEKVDNGESSCKDSDLSVVSSQPSFPDEEELGWDKIEDTASNDGDKKVESVENENGNRVDLRKRLSLAEKEEDLSWDIEDEDEDEPIKS